MIRFDRRGRMICDLYRPPSVKPKACKGRAYDALRLRELKAARKEGRTPSAPDWWGHVGKFDDTYKLNVFEKARGVPAPRRR